MKSRLAKCAKLFQEALHVRTDVLKEQSTRRSKFSHTGQSPMIQINSPLFVRAPPQASPVRTNGTKTPLMSQQPTTTPNQPPPIQQPQQPPLLFPGGDGRPDTKLRRRAAPGGGVNNNPYQSVSQVQMQYNSNDSQTRLNNATQVESVIAELSGMYSRMANLVAEQVC